MILFEPRSFLYCQAPSPGSSLRATPGERKRSNLAKAGRPQSLSNSLSAASTMHVGPHKGMIHVIGILFIVADLHCTKSTFGRSVATCVSCKLTAFRGLLCRPDALEGGQLKFLLG